MDKQLFKALVQSLEEAKVIKATREAEQFFAERSKNADPEFLREFLTRGGGEPPREGDELPD